MKIKADYANAPQWKETTIKSSLPKELKCLDEIAHNMWWAWNYEGRDLFKSLDADLYEKCNANPVLLLERLSYDRKEAIVKDKETMAKVKNVYKMFREYMDVKPNAKRPSVAYFCMEYGINQVVKIYSGGLGMLAGDYLKEASDSNVDMCAVGFLYRYGYFKQSLSMDGQQIANYDAQNFNSLPIERVYDENDNPLVVDVPYTNYQVHAYVWQMNVGRIKLYLLDTDNDMNSEFHHSPALRRRLGEPFEAGDSARYRWYARIEEDGYQEGYLSLQRGSCCSLQLAASLRLYRGGWLELQPGSRVGSRFFSLYCSHSCASWS